MHTSCSRVAAAAALVAAALLGAVSLRGFAPRAMTVDDLLTAIRISDPRLSPDGRTVVFVRTTTDLPSGRRNADIWRIAADGGGDSKELLGGDKTENTPRFSPDGKRLAFIATRDGAPQVYVADADGSGVKKVTDVAMGVQPPLVFSPDGTKIAVVAQQPRLARSGLRLVQEVSVAGSTSSRRAGATEVAPSGVRHPS